MDHGHLTPGMGHVTVCPICRTRDLVRPTTSVSLGWLVRLVAWGAALAAVHLLFQHPAVIVRAALAVLSWLLGACLTQGFWSLLSLGLALKVLAFGVRLVSPEAGDRMDPGKLLGWLLKATWRAFVALARALWWVVEGKSQTAKDKKAKAATGKASAGGDAGDPGSH